MAACLVAGCGGADEESEDEDLVPVDSSLVDLLADVALADARASLADSARQAPLADSLRAGVLAAHGLSADELAEHEDDLARDPETARATYDAVDRALTDERNPSPDSASTP